MKQTLLLCLAIILTRIGAQAAIDGQASWYGRAFAGKPMANGKPFNPEGYTCASWFYPIGSMLRVTNKFNGRDVFVIVTDRGPAKRLVKQGRVIDLSQAAFSSIASLKDGIIDVTIERL